ncbi:conserved hypothetical protein [Candidatus Nitrotoga sp. 1052]|nr:conserved hypothetical protein [Candidatus Nitrotoga sp. 1052]
MSAKKVEPNFTIIPESAQSAQQIFAEGMAVMIGVPVSKIQFHSTVGLDEKTGKELRQITFQAILPTSTLIEFCQNTLKGISDNEESLSKALNDFNSKILASSAKNKKG